MSFSMRAKSFNKAFSLVELLLVLGVIAALLVAGFIIYPQVRAKNQAKTEASNILMIQANVRTIFATRQGNYNGLGDGIGASDSGIANQARVFPTSMNNGDYSKDAPIRSSWGGNVVVWKRPQVTTPMGTLPMSRSFGIMYTNVPNDVCVHLLPALGSAFSSIAVGDLTAGQESTRVEVVTSSGTLDPTAVGRACTNTPGIILTST